MKSRRLWSLSLDTSPEIADRLAEVLGDGPLAVSVFAPPRTGKARLEVLYALKPDSADLTARLSVAAALLKIKPPKFQLQETPDLDWLKKVASDFPPLPIARWTIHGAHYRHAVPDRRRGIQIDATSAFGTGEHPTTRGCLLMLNSLLKRGLHGRQMLDMGCGSGILAMAWGKSGPGHALGVDVDEDSVRIAQDNARVNGLTGRARFRVGRGYTGLRHRQRYDLIMANIFARPLAEMAKNLRRSLKPGGRVILAGLLNHQANLVLAAHRVQRIYPVRILKIGEWSILLLKG